MVQEAPVFIFLDLGFNFQMEFHLVKFRSLPWFFCLNKLKLLYCLNKTCFSYSYVFSHWLQLLCQSALPYNEDYLQESPERHAKRNKVTLILLWCRGRATSTDIRREYCQLRLVWWGLILHTICFLDLKTFFYPFLKLFLLFD